MRSPAFWTGLALAALVSAAATFSARWIAQSLLGLSGSPISPIVLAIVFGMVVSNVSDWARTGAPGLRFCFDHDPAPRHRAARLSPEPPRRRQIHPGGPALRRDGNRRWRRRGPAPGTAPRALADPGRADRSRDEYLWGHRDRRYRAVDSSQTGRGRLRRFLHHCVRDRRDVRIPDPRERGLCRPAGACRTFPRGVHPRNCPGCGGWGDVPGPVRRSGGARCRHRHQTGEEPFDAGGDPAGRHSLRRRPGRSDLLAPAPGCA